MEWCDIYTQEDQPSLEQVGAYVNNDLWWEFAEYMRDAYRVQPQLDYSRCSMQRGWNVKYRRGGRALCTLYPMPGYFIALVVAGPREADAVELLVQTASDYTKRLYADTAHTAGGRWLMLEVTDREVLSDVKMLIGARLAPRTVVLREV